MGAIVNAFCGCGINSEIKIGGGMSTFTYICYFPCFCENCNDVVEGNLMNNTKCPNCSREGLIPYDDKQVIGIKGDHNIVSWDANGRLGRELVLTNGTYKCPQCNKMRLQFMGPISMWD